MYTSIKWITCLMWFPADNFCSSNNYFKINIYRACISRKRFTSLLGKQEPPCSHKSMATSKKGSHHGPPSLNTNWLKFRMRIHGISHIDRVTFYVIFILQFSIQVKHRRNFFMSESFRQGNFWMTFLTKKCNEAQLA